ncbi:MAG: phage terminase large subunit [Caulobacterales bacterium]
MKDLRTLQAVLRSDLLAFTQKAFQIAAPGGEFTHNWHLEAMAYKLEQCRQKKIKRLLITLPPRSLKSITGSVAFPAFLLGKDPSARIICASYSQDLAARHSRDTKNVMNAPFYRDIFPNTQIGIAPAKSAESEFWTTKGGFRLATSVGGVLTGLGGDYIIIDDPLKAADAYSQPARKNAAEWFDGTITSRLDSKVDGVIIVIMQRLHLHDLAGHLLEKGGWDHLCLPAIQSDDTVFALDERRTHAFKRGELLQPKRESQSALDELKRDMGSAMFSAQYLQRPVPEDSEHFSWSWFKEYDEAPKENIRIIQSWDTAIETGAKNSWSVCTTWVVHGDNRYLIDLMRRRVNYPTLKALVFAQARAHEASIVLIEKKASGQQLLQELGAMRKDFRTQAIVPNKDKASRFFGVTSDISAGKVLIPKQAHWIGDLRDEILQFPNGDYDDQVDSISQALDYIRREKRASSNVSTIGGTLFEGGVRVPFEDMEIPESDQHTSGYFVEGGNWEDYYRSPLRDY